MCLSIAVLIVETVLFFRNLCGGRGRNVALCQSLYRADRGFCGCDGVAALAYVLSLCTRFKSWQMVAEQYLLPCVSLVAVTGFGLFLQYRPAVEDCVYR